MNLRSLAIAAVLAFAPALAFAAPTWVVDHNASKLVFSSSVGGKPFTGVFRRWDAVIHFDPNDLAHSDVVATIDITSAFTGDNDRDTEMPDQDFFWTSHFPRAQFVAHSFQAAGPGRYVAIGELTIRGVTKPLNLPFALAISGAQAHMNARIGLNRLAFGIGQGDWQATDSIPAGVGVGIDLIAHRTP
jgi:polyisoprenoid-binding protein YceI